MIDVFWPRGGIWTLLLGIMERPASSEAIKRLTRMFVFHLMKDVFITSISKLSGNYWATEMREASHKEIVQSYYSKRAGDYDRQKARTWKSEIGFKAQILDGIVRAALTVGTGVCLEIGVGSGRVCLPLIKEAELCFVGIDLSKEMLKLAERKVLSYRGKSNLLLADAEHIPFQDNTFNLVICTSTLHYLTSPKRALEETSRVLKRKGVFVYGDVGMHEMDTTEFMDKLEKTISPAHAKYHKPSEMHRLIKEYGIRVTRTKIIPYRKPYASLIEDKANYFDIKSERLFRLIAKSTEEQKTLYEIEEKQITLFSFLRQSAFIIVLVYTNHPYAENSWCVL